MVMAHLKAKETTQDAEGRLRWKLRVTEHLLKMGVSKQEIRDVFTEVLGDRALVAPHHLMVPSASAVASLGLRMAAESRYADPAALSPRYVRK